MNQAVGMIEMKGLASAVTASDIMVKSANIDLLSIEKAKGFGWMTVIIQGDVGAVKAAIDAAKSAAIEQEAYVSSLVIPRPAETLLNQFVSSKQSSEETNKVAESKFEESTAEKVESNISTILKKEASLIDEQMTSGDKEIAKKETKEQPKPEKKNTKVSKKKTPKK